MAFDFYLQFFPASQSLPLVERKLRELFPIVQQQTECDLWLVRYSEHDFTEIFVGTGGSGDKVEALPFIDHVPISVSGKACSRYCKRCRL